MCPVRTNDNWTPFPLFFISVASKGLSAYVSGLESTLAGISISVDFKWVRDETMPHWSEDCLGGGERIRCRSEAGECAAPRPIGELGRRQCASMGPVVGLGLVGEPDPEAVQVTGRGGDNRSSGGRNCRRPCAKSRCRRGWCIHDRQDGWFERGFGRDKPRV